MMIKVLDSSENFSTSEKEKLNPSLEAKMLKIDIFCMKPFAQMKLIGFYLNHLVEEKHWNVKSRTEAPRDFFWLLYVKKKIKKENSVSFLSFIWGLAPQSPSFNQLALLWQPIHSCLSLHWSCTPNNANSIHFRTVISGLEFMICLGGFFSLK